MKNMQWIGLAVALGALAGGIGVHMLLSPDQGDRGLEVIRRQTMMLSADLETYREAVAAVETKMVREVVTIRERTVREVVALSPDGVADALNHELALFRSISADTSR